MPSIPEISIQNEAEEQLAERLEELEKLLQESESLRRRQFLVSGITLLLMLAVLTFFIIGLVFFFRTYPKRLLMQEVVDRNRQILGNPYHFGVNRKYDRKLIHYFLGETRRELQRRKPLLRQELRTAIRSLNAYARNELRKEFRTRVYRHLAAETKLYLKEKKLEDAARLGVLFLEVSPPEPLAWRAVIPHLLSQFALLDLPLPKFLLQDRSRMDCHPCRCFISCCHSA